MDYYYSCIYCCASIAAIHPAAAEVIACLYFLSATSHAANTHSTFVAVWTGIFLVTMYQSASKVICPSRKSVFGLCPIA